MNQPRLIEVDPYLVQFNSQNPRRHQGTEFERLKHSVREIGLVQLPTVRDLSGGGYECIDGEGRIRAAKEKGEKIWAVSFGNVEDDKALEMLMTANTIRYFGLLAECRGMANMYTNEDVSAQALANRFGISEAYVTDMIAVGFFPPDIIELIEHDLLTGGEVNHKRAWNLNTFQIILPLRQVRPGYPANPAYAVMHGQYTVAPDHAERVRRMKDGYDYTEVKRVVEAIIQGKINTVEDMKNYIANRRIELYNQNVDEEVRIRLESQLSTMLASREEALKKELEGATESTIKEYQETVNRLNKQIEDYQTFIEKLRKDASRNPQVLVERERDAEKKAADAETTIKTYLNAEKKLDQEKKDFQTKREREREQFERQKQQIIQQGVNQKLEPERQKLLQDMNDRLERERKTLAAQYSDKEKSLTVRTSNELSTMFARGIQNMAQTRVWLLNLVSPDVIQQLDRLSQEELSSLASEIIIMRRTLDAAVDVLRHGRTTVTEEENYVNA